MDPASHATAVHLAGLYQMCPNFGHSWSPNLEQGCFSPSADPPGLHVDRTRYTSCLRGSAGAPRGPNETCRPRYSWLWHFLGEFGTFGLFCKTL